MCNPLRSTKESWWASKAAKLQAAADRKDTKAFYEGLNVVFDPKEPKDDLRKGHLQCFPLMVKHHTKIRRISIHWKECFENVLISSSIVDEKVIESIPQRPELPEFAIAPSLKASFLQDVIQQLASAKAPGNDGIPPEI